MNRLLTSEEVADYLGLHIKYVQKWAREGVLRASKIGKSWRFKPVDIDRFIEENDNSLAGRNK